MNELDELVRKFDLNYFGTGQHKIGIGKARELAAKDSCFILDVRTAEEAALVKFGFAVNIPLNELPDRLSEIPRDKTIAAFCVSGTRSTMAAMYLQVNGYKDVKIVPESHAQMTDTVKPGSVLKGI